MKHHTTIVICNQKGGVGKTASAACLAQYWAKRYTTLVVDFDPQASLSGVFLEDIGITSFDTLTGRSSASDVLKVALPQYPPNLKVLPAGPELAEVDAMFAAKLDRFHVVQDLLAEISGFDVVIIDCPGSLSLLTLAPLVAADNVLIPTSCESMSFDVLDTMLATIEGVKKRLNPSLHMLPLAVTMFDGRNRLDHEVLAELRSRYPVFNAIVRRRVRIKEELNARMPCTSPDIEQLSIEVLERIRHEQKNICTENDPD